ncbi:hypothetical protein J5J83_05025 [Azoarcus sp. L1K30]|uniref:DUF6519 domain-containing protein n=1 Tax=Azoarcus sp. L1K30 TaxID=2820277 RepID=UPI001B81F9F0|nr:DUF6519 domain-containing protein [Azoarcus sp. L1K30]MBR0565481.1 hypothetical protein [Azoarcus sp. L1K30]
MKADLSRATFDPARRYRTVRMQQGRVQLDADWNEQQDILNHRVEIDSRDSLGAVAAPIDNAGFAIAPAGKDLAVSPGRLYVDGLLCENPVAASVARQPDLPATASPVLPATAARLPLPPKGIAATDIDGIVVFDNTGTAVAPADGTYLAYLEVWQRHLSTLDLAIGDNSMREVALGGPDTCTREQTVWQVKLLRAGDPDAALDCLSAIPAWSTLTAAPDGRLAARAEATIPPKTPCQLPPEAGYRLLENHLYRIEIHDDGTVTGKARYKWSRDNGSVLTRVVRWLDDPIADEFEVASIGRDDELTISAGCWVEFIDDTHELLGQPGPLVPVVRTEGNVVTVDLAQRIGHPLDAALFAANPRVRRWDGVVELKTSAIANPNTGWEELAQDGIELKFAPGSYRIGDYWLIPARTATADIEWPREAGKPAFLAPAGILRAFARLALLRFESNAWSLRADCRPLFPNLTELTQLHYVGGDGQSVMPNPPGTSSPAPLPAPLQVGVCNGQFPVANAEIRFTVDTGQLPNGTQTEVVKTLADGVASIDWSLDSDQSKPVQHAHAELLVAGQVIPGRYLPVEFTASLALARTVAYDPSACDDLLAANAFTVQDAIDTLCKRTHSGGGCCVTVGEGGAFPNLDVALRTLLEKGALDICLCLMPGQHTLRDDLSITGSRRHRILIHGCGAASRLVLREQLLQFDTFAALTLQDFTVVRSGAPMSMNFLRCGSLRMRGMDWVGSSGTGSSLLRITGSERLLIDDSRLLADGNDDRTLGLVLERITALAGIKAAFRPTAAIDGNLPGFAEDLFALSPEDKKNMGAQIATMIREAPNSNVAFSARQTSALNALRLAATGPSAFRLAIALEALGHALLSDRPTFALALQDTVTATIVNCHIRGRITLFGEGSDAAFPTRDLLARLSAAINQGAVTLDGSGELTLTRNRLGGLRLSESVFKDVLANFQGRLPVCSCLRVVDNRIESELDHYPGTLCALEGNSLEPEGDIGLLVGSQAKLIGNFSRTKSRLFALGVAPESFGNGDLTVTPV